MVNYNGLTGCKGMQGCKGIKLDPYLTAYTKINSKWIKYRGSLYLIRAKTIKLFEAKMSNLHDFGCDSCFLIMTSKAQAI